MNSDEQETDESTAETGSPTSEATETPLTAGPAKAPPWIASPDALRVVAVAAKAVGLSVEDLANLMVEGGITALPPSDGITGRYTLKDLGVRLWGDVQAVPQSERARWFEGLLPTQKTAVVVTLREQGYSSQAIAGDFGLDPMDVMRTWNLHSGKLGAQVVGIRLNTIAGNLQLVAERAQQGCMQKGDFSALWRIQKELTQQLQSIGIVDRAIHRVEVTHNVKSETASEIDKLLELERKQRQRREDVKQIEATVLDEIPDEVQEDYDGDG